MPSKKYLLRLWVVRLLECVVKFSKYCGGTLYEIGFIGKVNMKNTWVFYAVVKIEIAQNIYEYHGKKSDIKTPQK